jgi:hypothetical protein
MASAVWASPAPSTRVTSSRLSSGRDVLRVADPLVGVGPGDAHRLTHRDEELDRDARRLGDFARGETRLSRQDPLDRQQRKTALREGLLHLLDRDAVRGEVAQQAQARLARRPLEPRKQPGGLELLRQVGSRGAHRAYSIRNRPWREP